MVDRIIQSFDIWTEAQGLKSKGRVKSVDNISLEGIARLRELILELAVRGKLIPQDTNDESAKVLLKKIEKEKERLIKQKLIGKQVELSIISDDEKDFEIPSNWEWTRFGNITYQITDGAHHTPVYISDGVPFISVKDVSSGFIDFTQTRYISQKQHEELTKRCNPEKGDLLLTKVGTTGIPVLIETDIPFSLFVSIALIKFAKQNIYGKYLALLIKSPLVKKQSDEGTEGIGNKNLVLRKIVTFKIVIPPLAEQHRIVAKVDELMALCDKLETQQTNNLKTHEALVKTLLETLSQAADADELQSAWQRLSTHFDTLFCTENSIDQLKQTILQLAVMGKLVKQNPNDEPASELLKKITKEKEKLVKEGALKKEKPLLEISKNDMPFEIPKSWSWVPWGSILAYDNAPFKRGPFGSSLKKDMFVESGYKVYEQYCPINDDCSFERYYISDELFKSLEGFAVKANDYLVSCSGATLGRITQVPGNFKEGIINQALLRVRINHQYVDKDFFKILFRSPYFQKMIFDNSTGSAIPNVKGVNELKAMPVPFLPIEEQHKILKKVDELFALCDTLKEKLIQSQEIKGLLAKTVVEGAVGFVGIGCCK